MYDMRKINEEIDIKIIVNYYNIELFGKQLRCINPNHIDKKPSGFIGRNNKVNCKACQTSHSVIDTVMLLENCSLLDASKKAIEIANHSESDYKINNLEERNSEGGAAINKPIHKPKEPKQDIKKPEKNNDSYNKALNYCFGSVGINYLSQRQKIVEDYLLSRGITNIPYLKKVLENNKIYYGLDAYNQKTFFFTKENFGITRRSFKDNDGNIFERNTFLGFNKDKPFVSICSDKSKKYWFIVEGLFDALSLVDEGQNVICLNSVQNIDILLSYFEKNIETIKSKEYHYFIEFDIDNAGYKGFNEVSVGFVNLGLSVEPSLIVKNYSKINKVDNIKDLNDVKTQLREKGNLKLIDYYKGYFSIY